MTPAYIEGDEIQGMRRGWRRGMGSIVIYVEGEDRCKFNSSISLAKLLLWG